MGRGAFKGAFSEAKPCSPIGGSAIKNTIGMITTADQVVNNDVMEEGTHQTSELSGKLNFTMTEHERVILSPRA